MFTIIGRSSLRNVRFKLLILYLLNILDLFFTQKLLATGGFFEANPIMSGIMDEPDYLLLIKVLFPLFLVCFLSLRLRKANRHQLMISNRIITGSLIVYGAVNLMHIYWINISPLIVTSSTFLITC